MVWFAFLLDSTFILVTVLLFLTILLWKSVQRPADAPPGPNPAFPIIGHAYLLLGKNSVNQFAIWRRQYGDVFSLFLGTKATVVLNGYETIKEALVKQADSFSDRPSYENIITLATHSKGMVFYSGELWKAQRKASLEILRELGLGKNFLAGKIQEEVNEFVQELSNKRAASVDLAQLAQMSVSNNICSIVLGKRFGYEDTNFKKYIHAIDDVMASLGNGSLAGLFPRLRFIPGDPFKVRKLINKVILILDVFLKPFIDKQAQEIDEHEVSDFIGAYLRDIRNGKRKDVSAYVNEENLKQTCLDLYIGGTETTSTAIRWAVAYFLHHPDVQEKCFQEVERVVGAERVPDVRDKSKMIYLEATIMELLRIANVVPMAAPHSVSREVTLNGYRIPKDTMIFVNLDSVLRDPKIWGDPQTFRPERFIGKDGNLLRPDEFIPFSIGRRVCLGEALARMELFLYLASMIQQFRFVPPEDGQLPSLEAVLGGTNVPKPYKVRLLARQ